MALEDALPTLFILAIAMLCLAWLSRQLSVRTQLVVYFATGSLDLATLAIFLLLLPGVFVHELSHWVAAKLLGLRTSKFRVWPKRHKDRIGLGSVSVRARRHLARQRRGHGTADHRQHPAGAGRRRRLSIGHDAGRTTGAGTAA